MGTDPVYTEDQPKPTTSSESQEVLPHVLKIIAQVQEFAPAGRRRYAMELIVERVAGGTKKYGQSLHTWDGRDTIVDASQEGADLVMYLGKMDLEHPGAGWRMPLVDAMLLLDRIITVQAWWKEKQDREECR